MLHELKSSHFTLSSWLHLNKQGSINSHALLLFSVATYNVDGDLEKSDHFLRQACESQRGGDSMNRDSLLV